MTKKQKQTIFTGLLYLVNTIAATLLLFSYVLPYISPEAFPILAVISLIVPVLITINILFVIYWVIKLKKHFILSSIILVIGYLISTPLLKISDKRNYLKDDISLMSYNVRLFNHYKHINKEGIDDEIINFINKKDPDILAIQEFYLPYQEKLNYPYKYIASKSKTKKFGLAIFSKYKIINKGSLNFKATSNNSIYIDIIKNTDTIRIYNIHLQSLKINPSKENFGEQNSKKLIARLKEGFIKQVTQTNSIVNHQQKFKGKKILCGDFNNTAYSWVYKQLKQDKKDAFVEAGKGIGKSFNYVFPMRIDFILADKSITINRFKTYALNYSDHYPILSRLNLTQKND